MAGSTVLAIPTFGYEDTSRSYMIITYLDGSSSQHSTHELSHRLETEECTDTPTSKIVT